MSNDPYASEDQLIPIDLLLEPELAARENFDETKLGELIDSIRAIGIINALVVKPEGRHYRVIAGHRRLICARAAGLQFIKCKVWSEGGPSPEAIKAHENAYREDLNPAEEARYFGRLLETECGGDVDNLVKLVKQARDHIEGRLLLLQGDSTVLAALSASAISIGVAHELNRIIDPPRRAMYLDAAMLGGASVRMVREWRVQGNLADGVNGAGLPAVEGAANPISHIQPYRMECFLCQSDEDKHELEVIYVHRSCRRVMLRQAETGAVAPPSERKG